MAGRVSAGLPDFPCGVELKRPNGQRAYPAMRKDAIPNGMVTMSRQQMIPASMYPSHSPNPAKMTQMMFSSVLMGPILP